MANLSLLYMAEIVSGLRYKAVHLTANFGQLISRSNLQDSQIVDLQEEGASTVSRVTELEGDVSDAEANITALQAALAGTAYRATVTPFTVDLDAATTITPASTLTNPTVILPYWGARLGGETVVIYGAPNPYGKWTLGVTQSSLPGHITYYEMRYGSVVVAYLVKASSSTLCRWEFGVIKGGEIKGYTTISTNGLAIDVTDFMDGPLVVTNSELGVNHTHALPAIAEMGNGFVHLITRTTSTGDLTITEHASDGGSLVISQTDASTHHYLMSHDTLTGSWRKVELT